MRNANQEYNNYLKTILSDDNSIFKNSRAGPTIANSGLSMKFDLSKELPLINTKKLFYRGLIHEMVWFMNGPEKDGQLHIDYMIENKCDFWNKDLHNFYCTKNKISFKNLNEREEHFKDFETMIKTNDLFRELRGGLGRPYGAQWRDYRGADGSSTDQLALMYSQIQNKSDSRRLIVDAWKVDELTQMALPPCPKSFQFLLMNDRLDFILEQRSADSFLGVPFNIGEYALLAIHASTYAGLKPGIFTHNLNDAHIYCGVEEKGLWYEKNFDELRARIKKIDEDNLTPKQRSKKYLGIKHWIDTTANKPKEEWKEKYDQVTAVIEQLANDPNKYPLSKLEVKVDSSLPAKNILDNVSFSDFKVIGYEGNHYPPIKRDMSTG